MNGYEDLNREIQRLLARKTSGEQPAPYSAVNNSQSSASSMDILPLLQSLSRTYEEINTYLKTGNSEALKDVILRSDVKMSMVCETLLEALKQCAEDKKSLSETVGRLEETRRTLEETNTRSRVRIDQLEQELQYKTATLAELERLMKDQKERMAEQRNEAFKARGDLSLTKVRIEELESLRSKAAERMGVYEKEMDAVKALLKDKDDLIRKLSAEKKEEADKNSGVKSRLLELEQSVAAYNRKLTVRDRNLMLCNEELSKALDQNKGMKEEYEKYKDSASYYEGMYKTINKQNTYLNGQLNRLLQSGEYNKEGMAIFEKYQKTIKKAKQRLRKLRTENGSLKDTIESRHNETAVAAADDTLISRIEELEGERNTQKSKITQLERDKQEVERKIARLEAERTRAQNELEEYRNSLRGRTASYQHPPSKQTEPKWYGADARAQLAPSLSKPLLSAFPSNQQFLSKPVQDEPRSELKSDSRSELRGFRNQEREQPTAARQDYPYQYQPQQYQTHQYQPLYRAEQRADGDRPVYYADSIKPVQSYPEIFPAPSLLTSLMPELRQAKPPAAEAATGGYSTAAAAEYARPNLENDYGGTEQVVLGGFPEADNNLFRANPTQPLILGSEAVRPTAAVSAAPPAIPEQPANTTRQPSRTRSRTRRPPEDASTETVKSYHTTSSLKDMIARTEKLQQRFENLEEQLANIKEGNSEERLRDRLKEYNTHFSELDVFSNDSDFI